MRKFFAHALVEGQDPFLEYVLEILSLKHIENKLIGKAISDADRQKLTTAELALGTYSIMIYDQPFSGCDVAATYDLVVSKLSTKVGHSGGIESTGRVLNLSNSRFTTSHFGNTKNTKILMEECSIYIC